MKNLSSLPDDYVIQLAKDAGANPDRCTANEQLSINDDCWYLNVYEDLPYTGWDAPDYRLVAEERLEKPVTPDQLNHAIDDAVEMFLEYPF